MKTGHSSSKYRKEDVSAVLAVLAVLCLLLPPIGILLTWRARKVSLPLRGVFSAAALASATLITFLLMRPTATVTDIRPTPETPNVIGYGTLVVSEPSMPVSAPAQPEAAVPAAPSQTMEPQSAVQEGGELTDDTIVYAVTNNASSYHLYELCGQQENRRALTLRDALNEGLAPCEQCVGAMG